MKKLKAPLTVSGRVIAGRKVGRTIGFPTANLDLKGKALKLKRGIYTASCLLAGSHHLGLAYYGPRFVLGESVDSFEVYLFDLNRNIYGQRLSVKLIHFLRDPAYTKSLSALQKKIAADKKETLSLFSDQVILVNRRDRPLGMMKKVKAHEGRGRLHRAVSVFVFNQKGELLLQKRSRHKRLWPLTWSNTSCTHPSPGESITEAAARCLKQELGLSAKLAAAAKFTYQAKYLKVGSEHELDTIFIGFSSSKPKINRQEVAAIKYLSLDGLNQAIKADPASFTPWLSLSLKKLKPSDIVMP